MLDLKPWSSALAVEQAIAEHGCEEVGAWLSGAWCRAYLDAEPAAVREMLALLDLPGVRDRAATVLYAVERDWVEALEAADVPGCGFTQVFWREAFERAQVAGATRCVSWLLDRKGALLADARGGLEL